LYGHDEQKTELNQAQEKMMQSWWLMPVIPATQELEIETIEV
jgi:hypothetical protein